MDLRTMYSGPCSLTTWFVALALFLLAVVCLATVIGRAWTHVRMRRQSRRFKTAAEPLLKAEEWAEVVTLSQSNTVRRSPIARTVAAGLGIWLTHRERGTDPVLAWQVAQASMRQETDERAAATRRGVRALLVLGGTATLVGLLGGIDGLYGGLWAVSVTGPNALPALSAGVQQGLVTPAFGLLICLFALWAGVWLARSAERMRVETGRAVTSLLDQLARPSTTTERR